MTGAEEELHAEPAELVEVTDDDVRLALCTAVVDARGLAFAAVAPFLEQLRHNVAFFERRADDFYEWARSEADQCSYAEDRLRKELWLNHGHRFGSRYSEGGEMQCSDCEIADYLRAPIRDLVRQVEMLRTISTATTATFPKLE